MPTAHAYPCIWLPLACLDNRGPDNRIEVLKDLDVTAGTLMLAIGIMSDVQ